MDKSSNSKNYDLENRTYLFAKNCRDFTKKIHKNQSNFEYSKQLIRSSGSVAANYIEANESLSKKDFIMRVKISRKESKESRLWLRLIEVSSEWKMSKNNLIQESSELMKIFGAILEKCK
jgi:four helix bundle protein